MHLFFNSYGTWETFVSNNIALQYEVLQLITKFRFTFFLCTVKVTENIYVTNQKTKAVGPDGISIDMLALIEDFWIDFLLDTVNTAIVQHLYPTDWKWCIISPIPKKRNPTCYKELRPIRKRKSICQQRGYNSYFSIGL